MQYHKFINPQDSQDLGIFLQFVELRNVKVKTYSTLATYVDIWLLATDLNSHD
jgi:hypothetical protein